MNTPKKKQKEVKKPPPKENMKKSEKKARQEQLAAELRRQQEEERLAFLAGVKERKIAARLATIELAKKDDGEQSIRDDILKKIMNQFTDSIKKKQNLDRSNRIEQDWIQYLSVDGGPDPRQPPELSCALHRWQKQRINGCNFDQAKQRDEELYPILKVLDDIIKYPDDLSAQQLKVFKEVRAEISAEASAWVEAATRTWALDAPACLGSAKLSQRAASYRLEIWLRASPPKHLPRPQDPPPPTLDIDFPELGVSITLPGKNSWRGAIVRGIWYKEDRLSDACVSFADPKPLFTSYGSNMYEFTLHEYDEVCRLRNDQATKLKNFYDDIKNKTEVLQNILNEDKFGTMKTEKMEIDRLAGLEPEPMMLPRDIIIKNECETITKFLKSLKYTVNESEVNLRSHRPCGGILRIQLLQQPPKPKIMRNQLMLTLLEEDEKLTEVKFREIYNPPPPPAPGTVRTPEEIEADIRRQEAALERLFLISIQLPDIVLWIEPPIVCCWNADKKYWTTEDIHDLKYNEDKFTVNFRTGQLRPIAFATSKYSNLPYQGWELKPNDDHTGVIVTIMGAIIVCEFEVLEVGIKMKSLQNGATKALQDMVDETFTLNELTGRLQAGGVDFFPSEDAPNLIEGSCLKHWTMESHLYHCMAHLCTAYNFTWSRWNVTADRRAIVQQMREYLQQHSESFEILHVTPLQAILVTATEVSAEYSTQPIEGLEFYPDLYSLIKGHGSAEVLEVVSSVPWRLVENVKDLLCAIKPCSYS